MGHKLETHRVTRQERVSKVKFEETNGSSVCTKQQHVGLLEEDGASFSKGLCGRINTCQLDIFRCSRLMKSDHSVTVLFLAAVVCNRDASQIEQANLRRRQDRDYL